MSAALPHVYTYDHARRSAARDAGYAATELLRSANDTLRSADAITIRATRYAREAGAELQGMARVEADSIRRRMAEILAVLDDAFPPVEAENVVHLQAAE